MHRINAEVPLDSCPLSGYTVRDLFLVLRCCTGTDAIGQRSCQCVTLQLWTLNGANLTRDWDHSAKHNENKGEDTTTKSCYVVF